jgi:hypothetical protein
MIDKDELREYIRQVIREDLTVFVEHTPESHSDHAKIRVSLNLKGLGWHPIEEFSYTEDRIYEPYG